MKKILITIAILVGIATPFKAENRLSFVEIESYRFEITKELAHDVAAMIWKLKNKTPYVKEYSVNGVQTLVFNHGTHVVLLSFPDQSVELAITRDRLAVCDRGLDGILEIDTTGGVPNDFFYFKDSPMFQCWYPELDFSGRKLADALYRSTLIVVYEYLLRVIQKEKPEVFKNLCHAPRTRGIFFCFTIPLKRTSMLKKIK